MSDEQLARVVVLVLAALSFDVLPVALSLDALRADSPVALSFGELQAD